MPRGPRYSRDQAADAIAASRSFAEALRRLDMCATGGNHKTLRRYAEEVWGLSTAHFDPDAARRLRGAPPTPLAELLVRESPASRANLKRRLFAEGLKDRRCELCGQGETWRGRRMGLVLDHINGVRDDHRLENLRILCPNCNATLDTHCGRKNRVPRSAIMCGVCGRGFVPARPGLRFCCRECGQRAPRPAAHRPPPVPADQLREEIAETT